MTSPEAIAWLAKEIPKSEHWNEKVHAAAHFVTRAAEHNGPMIFAWWGCCRRSSPPRIHNTKS
jgi:hypothetical protein